MSPELFQGIVIVSQLALAGVLYSLRQTIKVAILESRAEIAETYATKGELRDTEGRLKEAIGLRGLLLIDERSGVDRRQT